MLPTRTLRSAGLGLALLASPAALAQQGGFTEAQRTELQGIIRDYLVKNPEVLQEALVELDRRQQEAQRTAQAMPPVREPSPTTATTGRVSPRTAKALASPSA